MHKLFDKSLASILGSHSFLSPYVSSVEVGISQYGLYMGIQKRQKIVLIPKKVRLVVNRVDKKISNRKYLIFAIF